MRQLTTQNRNSLELTLYFFKKLVLITLFLCSLIVSAVYAWDCHFILSYQALKNLHELSQVTVPAETLAQFLEKEKFGLIQVLDDIEAWSKTHIIEYPALPDALRFKANEESSLQAQFVQAIRVNPQLSYPLFLQNAPGRAATNATEVPESLVMLPGDVNATWIHVPNPPLVAIAPGELVHALDVISTASDEPDYGMDINLWGNNASQFGKAYGWGAQPFGNHNVEFSSQAPFHVGYFYERWLTYKVAPFLKRCYIEYRIHLFQTLSRYAFATNHPYWGYRFLGWGLHYIQDLTQPYHTTVAPNVSIWRIIFVSLLDMIGYTKPKQNLIQLITNRHFSLENYLYFISLDALKPNSTHANMAAALTGNSQDGRYPAYTDDYPRKIVGAEAHAHANEIDETIRQAFSTKYEQDPNYIFYSTEPKINLFAITPYTGPVKQLNDQLVTIMSSVGAHTRNFVRRGLTH